MRHPSSRYAESRWPYLVIAMPLCLLVAGTVSFAQSESSNHADVLERAKRATVGVLEDTQDPRMPEKPGKIAIRGTGFHLRDGYIVTARHAVDKNSPSGQIIPKVIHVITTDLHELVAQLVGDSAYLDVVVYRLNEKDRATLTAMAPLPPAISLPARRCSRWAIH